MSSKRNGASSSGDTSKKQKTEDFIDWELRSTDVSLRTINPIRAIVDKIRIPQNKDKPLIPLSIGDPTAFGNLDPPSHLANAIIKNVQSKKFNGYAPSTGLPVCREAVAEKYTCPEAPLTKDDIIVTSGCSGAIVIAIQGLGGTGDNILCPAPGFCLYETAANHSGIETKFYNLAPERQWEVDLAHLESMIDSRTRAIVVNNPSNPCGANYSKEHLLDILAVAEKHKIVIIADEIYADMVFEGVSHRMARLTTEVPVISCGGLAKQYLVPGWRVGWICIHDRHDRLKEVRPGMLRLSQLILGACTIAQSTVRSLLHDTEPSYYTDLMKQLRGQAMALVDALKDAPCLEIIQPQGAMYVMARVRVDEMKDIEDDQDFSQKLLDEEMVFVLPGACFKAPNFVRFVFCAPEKTLCEAGARITAFCKRHSQK